MKQITGIISDKNGKPIDQASVILMNKKFEQIVSVLTNENGEYCIKAEENHYPFLIAVKDYKENNLEFWCQNIHLNKDLNIDASIDKLEIYGLHCFRVLGAYPALTIYFRPMSLDKFKRGEADIAPIFTDESIRVTVNKEELEVLKVNRVEEYSGEINMTAFLIQVSLPKNLLGNDENLLDLHLLDLDGFFGQASIFF